jgi:hypothetical protein
VNPIQYNFDHDKNDISTPSSTSNLLEDIRFLSLLDFCLFQSKIPVAAAIITTTPSHPPSQSLQ